MEIMRVGVGGIVERTERVITLGSTGQHKAITHMHMCVNGPQCGAIQCNAAQCSTVRCNIAGLETFPVCPRASNPHNFLGPQKK